MKKKFKSFLNGKSFYAALALSVTMVGAACYFAYSQTSNNIAGELKSSLSSQSSERAVAEVKTDIPKATRAPNTQKTTAAEPQFTYVETKAAETVTEISVQTTEIKAEEAVKPEEKKYIMPVKGKILNEFSRGELVKSKTTGAWQTHNGVDISAALGDVVLSSGSGTVTAIDNDPLWGIMVTIDHGNGILTRYCNLNEGITVQVGQKVGSGEEIGAVGETADIETSEESHLHFEMARNGSFIDPLDIIPAK